MPTPKPQSKANMDPRFETILREFMQKSKEEYQKRSSVQQQKWFRPDDWNGDIFDVEGMSAPFDRSAANSDYLAAVSDPSNPGTTGDIVATTTMIDYLAAIERAFRARFMRRPRAMAHMLGRKKGHGTQRGPFIQCGVEYIRSVLKQAKVPQP